MSCIINVDAIAGEVFFLSGSKIIQYFLNLYFNKYFLTKFKYNLLVVIIGASNIGFFILKRVLSNNVHPPKSINCLARFFLDYPYLQNLEV